MASGQYSSWESRTSILAPPTSRSSLATRPSRSSWSQPELDPGRTACVPLSEGFNITIGGDNNDLYNKVQAGELDGVVDGIVPPPVLRTYSTDPTLQPRLHINPSDAVRYISFNMAMPPFDDVHVRKAINLALDKAGMAGPWR